jgi:hypothetical protein
LLRIATTVLVLGLLGGTAAAFAVTEGLKLQKSPIFGTQVTKDFSPVCRCPTASAQISFRLRHADHLTLSIETEAGRVVRTIFVSRPISAGFHTYAWNGRLEGGALAHDQVYKPRLELDDADRTINLPNGISVDTTRPHVLSVGVVITRLRVLVRYRASEHAHALLSVGRRVVVKTYRSPLVGSVEISRRTLKALGVHGHLGIALVDTAGNRSKTRVLRYVVRESA